LVQKPSITIQTFLAKIRQQDIATVKKQLNNLKKSTKNLDFIDGQRVSTSINKIEAAMASGNRQLAITATRARLARNELNNFSDALRLGKVALRDMISPVGALNTVLNIMTSRFGSMIIIFGVVTALRRLARQVSETTETFDTATRRLEGIVVPAFGSVEDAIISLQFKMLRFSLDFGVSIDQISNSMFFLASAGRNHAQILNEVDAVQKLTLATSKEMGASMNENKLIVEVFAGIMNIYGEAVNDANTEQARAAKLASDVFQAFKTQQILIEELAVGLSFASAQTRAMGISSTELIAILAVLNTGMVKGSKAGTSLANALRDALKSSAKLRENFGVDVADLERGFTFTETFVDKLNQELKTTNDKFTKKSSHRKSFKLTLKINSNFFF